MKNIRLILTCLFCFALFACESKHEDLSADKVYFFYQDACSHCHKASDYINKKYPDLKMAKLDIANHESRELFIKCARKFNLGNTLGTPLFCFGDNYVMGWSKRSEKKFDRLIKPFLK